MMTQDEPLNPSGMPDDALEVLSIFVAQQQPGHIVEVGSGRSTAVLAAATVTYGGYVTSLEHNPRFAKMTERIVAAGGLQGSVSIRCVPIEPHGRPGCLAPV
jgi:predicted O-methyltransferase YrrM